ncbi:(Fe-S)-binding protein [Dactylosporangium matsuzakiense]|uniref:Glycolate oxidase iron-sulfur subunit n=1 Tax=Dactylosporangium matsuzakiense TaxID=53360 RepID=A0A9W6KWQ2_9ACTN|nr:heterodisulfide reductase-related iron-sulfur binding cluster [Dactylosporangium matsuzakiense]UWZ46958.1 4Fe-4S dicluster domain-containing protein [Dactylosporangium matsuzakiense]GLL06849.1 glycolate oxidase iron-sulfur subunit [Dactylosporangium matsuzakiense]
MADRNELIGDCVHCGFCLPTCPTYVLWGEEMDSPRGRIQLMLQQSQGEPLTPTMAGHFDACLGCMACVTACPSGVKYDELITETRAMVEQVRPPAGRALRAAVFALFPYRRRLALAKAPLRAYRTLGSPLRRQLPAALRTLLDLAPPAPGRARLPRVVSALGRRRARVGMLTGCVQHAFFPGVNAATARVLAAEGCEVVIPAEQGCCGALSRHSGRTAEADRFATALERSFAGVDALIVNAAGCGSSLKESGALAAKSFDLAEFLADLGPVATRHPIPLTAAYHDACHLAHAQGIRAQPRSLLHAIPGLTLREIADPEICCGSAGIWNVLNPAPAAELGDRKARNVLATGASLLVTANPGCLMQIAAAVNRAGRTIRLAHTAEVLDASIRGVRP